MVFYALEEASLRQWLLEGLLMVLGRSTAAAKSLTLVHGEDGLGVAQRGRAQVNHVVLLRSRVLLQAGHIDQGLVASWRIILCGVVAAAGQHGRLTLHVLLRAELL